MINDASVVIGGGNWGIKEADVLGYKLINDEYYAREIDFANSTAAGTYTDSTGVIRRSPYNLLLQSNTFSNAAWLTSNVSVTSGQSGYDGTLNAWLLTSSLSNGFVYQNNTIDGINTFSIYGKAGTNTQIILYSQHATQGKYFDLSSGTVGANFVAAPISASIENVGGGWYRCSIVVTASANLGWRIYNAAVGTTYIQNAQAEKGDIATDYFPTTDRLNVPRIDYRNADGSLSTVGRLLLEPQRSNDIPNSENIANWTLTNLTRTLNQGISPDGFQNADLLASTTSGAITFNSDTTITNLVIGQPIIFSFFVKLNAAFTTNTLAFRLSNVALWSRPVINVNLQTGEATNVNNASNISSTNYGNGWYRIAFGATPTGTGTTSLQSQTGATMDGGSFFIWGLQAETNSSYATSYIPTLGAAVTRNADVATKTGVSSWIGQTEGTVFVDVNYQAVTGLSMFVSIRPNSTNKIEIYRDGTTIFGDIFGNSVNVLLSRVSNPAGRYKIALAYKSGQTALYINGTSAGTSATAFSFATSMADLSINLRSGPTFIEQAFYNQVMLFPNRLTDSQLQSLTTL